MNETSRLSRDGSVVLNVLDQLRSHGVSIAFVEQGLDSSELFRDLLCASAMSGAAFLESLSHAVRRGQKACVANGFIHGSRRYGYDHAPSLTQLA